MDKMKDYLLLITFALVTVLFVTVADDKRDKCEASNLYEYLLSLPEDKEGLEIIDTKDGYIVITSVDGELVTKEITCE